ncbi:hypothetical protein ACIG3E_33020 [Streptomyces sp. NPDC053474]|uniref:hypothetical protein n=1 Tax=Streptomyces sp. NPDC053474 TaxID=3365704 RepID=UPI0037D5125A
MADLTLDELVAEAAELEESLARDADNVAADTKAIEDEADDTTRTAESIARMRVDPETVSETHAVAKLMKGISEGANSYASASKDSATHAKAVADQARQTHGGIQEAISRSPAQGIYEVDRAWLTVL